jgi:hypothetical protein
MRRALLDRTEQKKAAKGGTFLFLTLSRAGLQGPRLHRSTQSACSESGSISRMPVLLILGQLLSSSQRRKSVLSLPIFLKGNFKTNSGSLINPLK